MLCSGGKRLLRSGARYALWTQRRTIQSSRTWLQVKNPSNSGSTTAINANVASKQVSEQSPPINPTGEEEEIPKYKPGWFSRNPGWTLGGILFAIALYVYRSSKSKKNFEALQLPLADQAVISPYEAWELRSNNSITPELFEQVWKGIFKVFPNGKATLSEFDRYLGFKLLDACPQGMAKAYHLERVLMSLPKDDQQKIDIEAMLVAFALAVKGTADERLECLFHLATRTPRSVVEGEEEANKTTIRKEEFERLLSYLLTTYQIPSEKRILPIPDASYPFQEYQHAQPCDLLHVATEAQVTAKELTKEQAAERSTYTIEEFATLMKSKSICIWGECFTNKRKKMKN